MRNHAAGNDDKSPRLESVWPGALFIMLIGMFIAITAFIPYNIDRRLMNNGTSAEGTVIDFDEQSSRGSTTKVTTVSFTDSDGGTHTIEERAGVRTATPDIGSKHTVYYNPDRPDKAVVEGWEKSAGSGFGAGGFFIMFGVSLVVMEKFSSKRAKGAGSPVK
ncbi:DUF3592 domain-containing protein [Arthrobacter sp. zg-Y238]|uniref:DUF3592 domain-containing protein n=1 Tax=Arthrobacter sp. zg-Y238 TaxID=2964614 RepID=UPI002105D6D1|nr:DUF3592 domain-containing protein [Arthrobacter sp. zg-Y238]MCQ1952077.1 DUF3592 domain-containing protein [Arthrobacter sp. zg-Y238]